jgi:hypothetical protein
MECVSLRWMATSRMRLTALACLGATLAAGCWSPQRPSDPNARVLSRPDRADYEPSIMLEDGLYRMWWCGDGNIYYAQSTSLDSGWAKVRTGATHACANSSQCEIALKPREKEFAGSPNQFRDAFDRSDVCDPSVIRVGSTYYMYYGAVNYDEDDDERFVFSTHIGVAESTDGIHWTRHNAKDDPLLSPTPEGCPFTNDAACPYGIGQPSVFYDFQGDGRYYMVLMNQHLTPCTTKFDCSHGTVHACNRPPGATEGHCADTGWSCGVDADCHEGICDPTGFCAKGGNFPALFVVRATDPYFRVNTQVWTGAGWQAYTPPYPSVTSAWTIGNNECCSDWVYDNGVNAIVRSGPGVSLLFLSPAFVTYRAYAFNPPTQTSVYATEGPGIVRRPDGHSVLNGVITSFDLMRSVCDDGSAECCPECPCFGCENWDLAHVGVDFADVNTARFMPAIGSVLLGD